MAEDPVAAEDPVVASAEIADVAPALAEDGKIEEEQVPAEAAWGESSWKEQGDAGWGESSWKKDESSWKKDESSWKEDESSWKEGESSWKEGESSWKEPSASDADAAVAAPAEAAAAPAEEPKETIVEINARSSNTELEDGGIRVDDLSSFQYRMLAGPVSSASGAWLEATDAPTASRFRTGKIFTLNESSGALEQRKRAQKYARFATSAKNGWTTIDTSADDDKDLSVMTVPEDSRNKVIGNNGLLLAKLSEDKKVVIVAIDDGNSVAKIVEVQPPEPWLAVGQQVQILHKGDVRFKKWMSGTVKKIVSQSMVAVGLEKGGTDVVVDWYSSARPNFKESEELEAYVEVLAPEPAGENSETWEPSTTTSSWVPATFLSWADSGSANIKKSDGTEVELDARSVRPPLLVQEETAEEEVPRPPIRLAIFGEERGRVEAVLSIMSNVEWVSPGFFNSSPAPLPPALDTNINGDETVTLNGQADPWVSTSVEIADSADKVKKLLPQIQKACDWKALIEICGSNVQIIGPRAACCLARGLVSLAAVADRSEVAADQFPQGLDSYVDRVSMPGDLVPFIAGKQRNRLNEIEAEESVIVFFMRHPEPEKAADAEVIEEVKEDAESAEKEGEPAEASKDEKEAADGDASEDKAKVEQEAPAPAEEEKWGKDWDKGWDAKESKGWDTKESKSWDTKEWPAEEEKPKVDILIFSMDARSRMRARLPLFRAVEAKSPGCAMSSDDIEERICVDDVAATDILDFETDSMGWLSGKQGCNKKRIVAASGCKMEFLTHFAFLAGTQAERVRARQYLQWLLLQRPNGGAGLGQREIAISASELESRDDVTVMMLSTDEKSSIIQGLGDIEDETGCFMVFQHKPDADFFSVGEKMTITRGGRSFFIEINEAPAGEEMNFSCKLLPEDPWIDENEASKVPLLIFSFDTYQRSAGEKKIRDVLTPAEEATSWEEAPADDAWNKKDSWGASPPADKWNKQEAGWGDKAGGDKWDTSGKEKNSWEKPANDWGKKDEKQEWNGSKKASAWGEDAPADNKWGSREQAAAPPGYQPKSDAPAWGKEAASNDKWGKNDSWDKPAAAAAPAADNKWGNYGSDKKADSKDVRSWDKKPADSWGQKEEWNGNGAAAAAASSPWDNYKR